MTTKELFALPIAKPRFIEPMYITEVRELPAGPKWAYEAKLDGYRCLAAKDGRVTLCHVGAPRSLAASLRLPKHVKSFRRIQL
jgi:hypothetical protein